MRLERATIGLAAALGLSAAAPGTAAVAPEAAVDPGEIVVTGVADPRSAAATGLNLTLSETPQSVTIVDQARVRDFRLNTANELLEQVVGVNVERAETDRTQFNSRGFEITNFQVDGIGLPLASSIQFGDLDTVLFERVETVRGADAMLTGIGNPSAAINFVRKRPLDRLHATVAAQVGSWDAWRVEGDAGGPLDDAGRLTARLVAAHEEHDSYLRFNHVNRDVGAALVAWAPSDSVKLTLGIAQQSNDSDGNLWGALPLIYADGGQIDYPRATSTAQPWSYWRVRSRSAFAELAVGLGAGWSARGVLTINRERERVKLLYATGNPDRETGLGIVGFSGLYPSRRRQRLADVYASGPFELFGRRHQLALGLSAGRTRLIEYEADPGVAIAYPSIYGWDDLVIAEPDYPEPALRGDTVDRLTRGYAAAHLDLADRLKAVVGASYIRLKSSGSSYETDQSRRNRKVSPYAGLVLDLTRSLKLYGSYTDIFNPQSEVDETRRKLAPARGTSIEAGVKGSWFGGRLYATAALFHGRQKGLAAYAGSFDDSTDFYTTEDTTAKGVEFEIAGRITPEWRVDGGVTLLSVKGEGGEAARRFVPRRSLKLATTYRVPEWRNLTVGAQLRAQSRVLGDDDAGSGVLIRQGSYAVLDLIAAVDVAPRVTLNLNLDNVTGRKYLNGLQWGQAFYAAPRNVRATLSFAY